MASVRLDNICKNFGAVRAVDRVSIEIPDGELMVLVGPSGCGKSTLLRLVAGLEEATSGGIFIDDREVSRMKPQDRDVAMVLRSRTNHARTTDVYLLDSFCTRDSLLCDRRLKGIEVHDDEVDPADAVSLHSLDVCRLITQGEDAAMHHRMKSLHPTVHHLRKARVIGDLSHRNAGL